MQYVEGRLSVVCPCCVPRRSRTWLSVLRLEEMGNRWTIGFLPRIALERGHHASVAPGSAWTAAA
jgi:hypothetical protein